MTVLERLQATFYDKDGAYCIPELSAAAGGLLAILSTAWDVFYRGHSLDLQAFGIGLGVVIAAMGAAQRIRDGLLVKDPER